MAALPLGQTGAVRQAAAPGEAPLAEGCNEPFAVGTNLVEGLMRRPPPAGLLCVVCLFGLLDARPAGAQANPDFDAVTWTPLTCDAALLTALDPRAEVDLVGDALFPAAYVGRDATYLYPPLSRGADPPQPARVRQKLGLDDARPGARRESVPVPVPAQPGRRRHRRGVEERPRRRPHLLADLHRRVRHASLPAPPSRRDASAARSAWCSRSPTRRRAPPGASKAVSSASTAAGTCSSGRAAAASTCAQWSGAASV